MRIDNKVWPHSCMSWKWHISIWPQLWANTFLSMPTAKFITNYRVSGTSETYVDLIKKTNQKEEKKKKNRVNKLSNIWTKQLAKEKRTYIVQIKGKLRVRYHGIMPSHHAAALKIVMELQKQSTYFQFQVWHDNKLFSFESMDVLWQTVTTYYFIWKDADQSISHDARSCVFSYDARRYLAFCYC